MVNDAIVELWDKAKKLPGKLQLTIIAAAAVVFSAGYFVGYQHAFLKFENEIEDAGIEKRHLERMIVEIEADTSSKNCGPTEACQGVNLAAGEEVVETSLLAELKQRPEQCEESAQCDGIMLKAGQSVIDDADLKVLRAEVDRCSSLGDESLCVNLRPSKQDCIAEKTFDELAQIFLEHPVSARGEIFNDHYRNKWMCGEGWIIQLKSKPIRNDSQYWELEGSTWLRNREPDDPDRNDDVLKIRLVSVILREGSNVSQLKKDSEVSIQGKLVEFSQGVFKLVEGEYEADD